MSNTTHKRIEYIDAMRGFTMFLVVFGHVSIFGLGFYGKGTFHYHQIADQIQMPLFFFISGFVFYKANLSWTVSYSLSLFRKKLSVLVLSPFLF